MTYVHRNRLDARWCGLMDALASGILKRPTGVSLPQEAHGHPFS
jgi:hypothetical protein